MYFSVSLLHFATYKNCEKQKQIGTDQSTSCCRPIRWFPMDEKVCGRMLSPVSSLLQAWLPCQLIYETSSVSSFRINHFLPSDPFALSPSSIAFDFPASSFSSLRLFFLTDMKSWGNISVLFIFIFRTLNGSDC